MRVRQFYQLISIIILMIQSSSAQDPGRRWITPPPTILVQGDVEHQMKLTEMDVDVQIYGDIVETQTTMTFYNPNDRDMAGEFVFPLPEDALINGFALDLKGKMVEASVVEKRKAREVFEKEVRKNIDPAIVEYTQGNNYKTRIFPLPRKGTRKIMIRYMSKLIDGGDYRLYQLPLNFKDTTASFRLNAFVHDQTKKPKLKAGYKENVQFVSWHGGFKTGLAFHNEVLNQNIRIEIPKVKTPSVSMEHADDGEYYFYIHDHIEDNVRNVKYDPDVRKLSVLWDASGSRENDNHDREYQILKEFFKSQSKSVDVTLSVIRNEIGETKSFKIKNGNADELIRYLKSLYYDGASQLGIVRDLEHIHSADMIFLFSDGLSNFGVKRLEQIDVPVMSFSEDPQTDHHYLKSLSQRSGGYYFNLARQTNEQVAEVIKEQRYFFMGTNYKHKNLVEGYPYGKTSVTDQFGLVGKLKADNKKLLLYYGPKRKNHTSTFQLKRSNAKRGNVLRRYWAQQKINELMMDPNQYTKEILETAKEYKIVTPQTSMIVLENIGQYVEHEVEPPLSEPELREQYFSHMKNKHNKVLEEKSNKIDRIAKLWENRKEWWSKDFPKVEKEEKKKLSKPNSRRSRSSGNPVTLHAPQMEMVAMEDNAGSPSPSAAGRVMSKTKKGKSHNNSSHITPEPSIELKAFDPKTPYLEKMKSAENAFNEYLKQRTSYASSPSFYLDCAEYFLKNKERKTGIQILSNLAELEFENAAFLRLLAYRLRQANEAHYAKLVFEDVLRLRPEEPQSYRDLALILADLKEFNKAVELLYQVVVQDWDRFHEIELTALLEMNRIISQEKVKYLEDIGIDKRLIGAMDLDVRIVMSWDTDLTDIDLWVHEPAGDKAYYGHRLTRSGGLVSRDFTRGYGPEEYLLKKSWGGEYRVEANYYGNRSPEFLGVVHLYLDVYTNYGRENEKHQRITLRLGEKKEVIEVGKITF